jgi:hypothetical protein
MQLSRITLVVTTDSQAVFYMLNSLRVRAKECREIIFSILEQAQAHHIEIIANWVPRGYNTVADAFTKWSECLYRPDTIPLPEVTQEQHD